MALVAAMVHLGQTVLEWGPGDSMPQLISQRTHGAGEQRGWAGATPVGGQGLGGSHGRLGSLGGSLGQVTHI